MTPSLAFDARPLSAERLDDARVVFGPRGGSGGCWCQYFRQTRAEHAACRGEPNRSLFEKQADDSPAPGLIGYVDDVPCAWVAVAPREDYTALARSRVLKPWDDTPVWVVSCFIVTAPYRRQGLMTRLVEAAAEFAGRNGAVAVEGYPLDITRKAWGGELFVGVPAAFEAAGFTELGRRSPTRPIYRKMLT